MKRAGGGSRALPPGHPTCSYVSSHTSFEELEDLLPTLMLIQSTEGGSYVIAMETAAKSPTTNAQSATTADSGWNCKTSRHCNSLSRS